MSRILAIGLGVLALVALEARAQAFVAEPSKWPLSQLPVGYRVNPSTAPASLGSATALQIVDAGFATWAAQTCTSWSTRNLGDSTKTQPAYGDRENTVAWMPAGRWPSQFGPSAIGVTVPQYTGSTTVEAEMFFNAQDFSWATTGRSGTVDAQTIATHEEGHFLGLDHTPDTTAVMYFAYSGGTRRSLLADDRNGVCSLYPGTGPGDGGVTRPDVVTPPDVVVTRPDVVPAGAGLGENCEGVNCATGLLRASLNGQCVCTRRCTTNADCNSITSCQATPSGSFCVPGAPAAMGSIGDPCTAASDCTSMTCLPFGTDQFCSQRCSSDCDCPSEMACATVAGGRKYCVPGTHACGAQPDAGTVAPGPDAAAPAGDAGAYFPPDVPEKSCACRAAGAPPSGQPRAGAVVVAFLAATLAAHRSRRRAR